MISVAKQFVHQGVALEDLIMEGNIGLINAIDKFDPTRGFKLSTYAVWWIRQSILQSLAEKGRAVRMPLNQVGLHMRVRRAAQTFLQTHERPPMPDELAELLGLPEEKVKEVMNNAAVEFSIDKPISDDSEMSYADTLESSTPATDTIVQQESLCTDIQRWLMVLENDRARDIMQRSFGLNGMAIMSLEELAAKYRLSRERVRQIQQQALQTLRNHVPSYIY